MAKMTQEQITAELQRKVMAGEKPTSAANQAQYNNLVEVKRKADNNIALTDTSNKSNVDFYNKLKQAATGNNATTQPAMTIGSNPVQTTSQPAPSQPSFVESQTNQINSIYDNNYNSQLQKLRQAAQTQQQSLNASETQAKQAAYQQKNQADGQAIQAAQRLRELMAEQGITGGDNISAQSRLQAAAQGQIGAIGQQEQNTLRNIMEQRNLINNNQAGNELALMQELQAARAGQLLDLGYRGDEIQYRDRQAALQRALQEAALTGTYGGQQTLQGRQFASDEAQRAWQNNYNMGVATGTFDDGARTLDSIRLAQDIAQRNWANQYQVGRDKVADSQWNQTFNRGVLESDWEYERAGQQYAQQMGLDWAKMNQNERQFAAEMAYRNANLAADTAYRNDSLALDRDRLDLDRQKLLIPEPTNTDPYNKAMQQAISLAQKDPQYKYAKEKDRQKLVDSYYKQIAPKQIDSGLSDDDILNYLK